VRQLPRDGVPGSSYTPAASAPAHSAVIGLQDPARQDRAIGLQTLADHDQAELIQAAERSAAERDQVRAAEGGVRHVELFQMGGLGTSILGRPRHLPRYRRASHHPTSDYTFNCEEPIREGVHDGESAGFTGLVAAPG